MRGGGFYYGELLRLAMKNYTAQRRLWLSISKSIITEHGGDIQVKSSPGDGATFTVLLPARDAS